MQLNLERKMEFVFGKPHGATILHKTFAKTVTFKRLRNAVVVLSA